MPDRSPSSPAASARQRGQSLPEFLIVVPVFIFLMLLIFQMALIYRAKTTLDYAVLEAARAGAVNNAKVSEMRDGLARGLTPLYATSSGLSGVYTAWGKAKVDLLVNSRIQVISPTRRTWNAYKERQYDRRYALPNDSLAFRDTAVRGGEVSVQDANILKIRVVYYYPLVVPFVDLVLRGQSDYVPSSGMFDPDNIETKSPLLSGPVLGNHYRIPLESFAIVRMQTPIYDAGPLP